MPRYSHRNTYQFRLVEEDLSREEAIARVKDVYYPDEVTFVGPTQIRELDENDEWDGAGYANELESHGYLFICSDDDNNEYASRDGVSFDHVRWD